MTVTKANHEGVGMKNPIEVLCAHAGRSLPDSIRERKAVLGAMEKVLREDNLVHRDVRAQLAGIAAVEKLNLELKLRCVNGGRP